jgi:hypothetical protein
LPKLLCDCGYIHNLSFIPDEGYIILKDKDYETLIDLEMNLKQSSSELDLVDQSNNDLIIAQINRLNERLYLCPECNEIQWIKSNGTIERYRNIK